MSKWIIIYPCGDRSKISTAEICSGMEYEINEYALASRQEFHDEQEAWVYARQLARDHGKNYVGDGLAGDHDYLD